MIILILILALSVFISNFLIYRTLAAWSKECLSEMKESLSEKDLHKALKYGIHAEIFEAMSSIILISYKLGLLAASIIGAIVWAVL